MRNYITALAAIIIFTVCIEECPAQMRIKDLGYIHGLQSKMVTGYGLVTGLNGSGDGTRALFTIQAVANMLRNVGLMVDANRIRMRNVAAVLVTAELPPFTKRGAKVDCIVSSLGDATSLEGGTLIQTPLRDINGNNVAWAQGQISTGGLNLAGAGGTARQNYTLTGRVPKGVTSELDIPLSFLHDGVFNYILNEPDFTTCRRIGQVVNNYFQEPVARTIDAATISVRIPPAYQENDIIVQFVSEMEQLDVNPDIAARVVINERSGTVVMGRDVRLTPVAISHGDISIQIQPAVVPGQPPAAPQAASVVSLTERETGNIGNLVDALNALQVEPKDIIAIFQALKEAGALKAQLIIM